MPPLHKRRPQKDTLYGKSICIKVPKAAESDLYLNVFGHSVTEPLHKAGPCVKAFCLIHFILEGEGSFIVNNVTYHLKKGQGNAARNYSNQADSYRLTGMLYLFLSVIAKTRQTMIEAPSGSTYVNHAAAYIQNHYSIPVSIEEISDYVGINRSYLSSLFKEYTGMSPIEYLQNFRNTQDQHMLTGMSPKNFGKEKRKQAEWLQKGD